MSHVAFAAGDSGGSGQWAKQDSNLRPPARQALWTSLSYSPPAPLPARSSDRRTPAISPAGMRTAYPNTSRTGAAVTDPTEQHVPKQNGHDPGEKQRPVHNAHSQKSWTFERRSNSFRAACSIPVDYASNCPQSTWRSESDPGSRSCSRISARRRRSRRIRRTPTVSTTPVIKSQKSAALERRIQPSVPVHDGRPPPTLELLLSEPVDLSKASIETPVAQGREQSRNAGIASAAVKLLHDGVREQVRQTNVLLVATEPQIHGPERSGSGPKQSDLNPPRIIPFPGPRRELRVPFLKPARRVSSARRMHQQMREFVAEHRSQCGERLEFRSRAQSDPCPAGSASPATHRSGGPNPDSFNELRSRTRIRSTVSRIHSPGGPIPGTSVPRAIRHDSAGHPLRPSSALILNSTCEDCETRTVRAEPCAVERSPRTTGRPRGSVGGMRTGG